MAQPSQFIMKYEGSMLVKKGEQMLGSSMSPNTVMKMKTRNVNVSINNGVMFPTTYDEVGFADLTATYVFDKDCVIAYGIMVEVV